MQRHAHGSFTHPKLVADLRCAPTNDQELLHDQARATVETVQQTPSIQRAINILLGRCDDVIHSVNVNFTADIHPAQNIDGLISSDGVQPRSKRHGSVPVGALQMHGEKRLLHDIFNLRLPSPGTSEETPDDGSNMRRDRRQQFAVSKLVAPESQTHQAAPLIVRF